ncbi:hypothetical protein [Capnocytophaga cynodegmi]|uniref:Uncharacterized protein n=1 Tax=Capnocytophaga cynodegmi TaxID=28189 RepID=A0A0B7HIL0_9FLAO|nr:hypothetical protein [Capnocytophaga cynodegmi]CEN36248.1 conserved hypothetical protein [Capnocytophaga cynodegmi]CEN38494.1 conserved hypothetical protein [Capnocytophaga cynodegmi]CEN38642.1 conserved hypothetical protein [Capnocytophaga cynodegmi]
MNLCKRVIKHLYFIDFHYNELKLDVTTFVNELIIASIDCWGDGVVAIDYKIAPEESDEILAIKFNKKVK